MALVTYGEVWMAWLCSFVIGVLSVSARWRVFETSSGRICIFEEPGRLERRILQIRALWVQWALTVAGIGVIVDLIQLILSSCLLHNTSRYSVPCTR